MSEVRAGIADRLNDLLEKDGLEPLGPELASRFGDYCALLMRWNARVNLTAIRDEEGILSRHFVEGIACARALPSGIATLLDFGSGGGFPGIPIALCRSEISVTLAESQGKKAAFLQEAVRVLALGSKVHRGRAEALGTRFDCVALRAVDRMAEAVRAAAVLVSNAGWLALMTTGKDLDELKSAAGEGFSWQKPAHLPGGDDRLLVLGQRAASLLG